LRFAIVSIGTELNLGLILNTNSKYIAEILSDMGLECNYMITVRDSEQDILNVLKVCLNFSDIIIITGGLGPTDDDLTRIAVAKFLKRKLIKDSSLDNTSLRFLKYLKNDKVTQALMRQSYIPDGSIPIKPEVGSASGFIINDNGKSIIAVPGVPREMRDMFERNVIPYINSILKESRNYRTDKNEIIKKRILLTTDISESQIEYSIKKVKLSADNLNVYIGVTASPGLIKIMLIARAMSLKTCEKNLKIVEKEIRKAIGGNIYGTDRITIGDSIYNAILNRKDSLTISAAESITGGLISSLITDTPGSSKYFLGSIISYSDFAKESILGINNSILKTSGAVSREVCIEMAQKAKKLFSSDLSISATGIAGPTSPEKGKDVGLVYCSIAGPGNYQEVFEKRYIGTRTDIKFRTSQFILNQLRNSLENSETVKI